MKGVQFYLQKAGVRFILLILAFIRLGLSFHEDGMRTCNGTRLNPPSVHACGFRKLGLMYTLYLKVLENVNFLIFLKLTTMFHFNFGNSGYIKINVLMCLI